MPRIAVTISGKNPQPYRFSLDRETITIGRAADNEIVVDCPSVSSHHCAVERVEGGYILRDKNSTNGIKSHGYPMEVIDLTDGLDVFIGDVELEFTLTAEENEVIGREDFTPHERKKLPPAREEKPRRRPQPEAQETAVSAPKESSAFTTIAAILLALLAFAAGVNASYNSSEKKNGRDNVSLLHDIQNGRPIALKNE